MAKQVKVHVSRAFTFHHAGGEIQFKRGVNVVDADVAAHPFVKAHAVDEDVAPDAIDPQAYAAAIARAEKAEAKVAELAGELDDVTKAAATAAQGYAAAVADATTLMDRATAAEAKVAALELAEAQRLAATPSGTGKGK